MIACMSNDRFDNNIRLAIQQHWLIDIMS
jgi:hypothetical protein